MPPPETYKVKSAVSLRYARPILLVHTSHYSRLEKPTIPLATQDYHGYIARSTYHYAYARRTQVNWKKDTKKRTEDKEKERKDKKAKKRKRTGNKRKDEKSKKIQQKQEKTRQEEEARKGKAKKKCHASRP